MMSAMSFKWKLAAVSLWLLLRANLASAKERRIHVDMKVTEIDKHLMSARDDPFADEDKWADLTDAQRTSWTASNEFVDLSKGMPQVFLSTKQIRREGISVTVEVYIVVAEKLLSEGKVKQIGHYAKAMRAGSNGTSLSFRVKVAPQALFKRLAMHSTAINPSEYLTVLEQSAASFGGGNVLFVIVNHRDKPVNKYESTKPIVGNGRVAWIMHNIEKGNTLNVASLLTSTERAAERVYAPRSLYYPVPLIRHLRVEVAAYTPGHEHRALWLRNFDWNAFETAVRSVAVHGQTVSFFSTQVNVECDKCVRAFRDVEKYSRDFSKKAAAALNNDVMPNETWAKGMTAIHLRKRIPSDSFRVYVLDTVRLRKTEHLQRLERRPLSVFPGMGVITFRSSEEHQTSGLQTYLVKATVAGVYGIAEPELYVHTESSSNPTQEKRGPSAILQDVIVRNLVRSVTNKCLTELEEIVGGIVYFDIDPAKSLGEREFIRFAQRVNLMLAKVARATAMLAETNDLKTALFIASSTSHDMRAIRSTFELEANTKTFERFRDPTLRCHFSRLRREALRASEILETDYPNASTFLLATLSFIVASTLTSSALRSFHARKSRSKRE